MLGNLSKSLVKTPGYFYNIQNKNSNTYKLTKMNKQHLLDTYSNFIKTPKNINNSKHSFRYFKEGDFTRRNLFLDLNYNNNVRKEIIPKIKTSPTKTFEELIYENKNNKNNKSNSTIRTKTVNEIFSPISTNKRNNFKNFLSQTLITKDKIKDFNDSITSRTNNLIDKINNMNSLNYYYNKYTKKFTKGYSDISSLKNKINDGQYLISPIKFKFPNCINNFKSQDNIFRDSMDSKLNSLSSLSPKIKEDLKIKNRNYVSKNEYFRYQNLWSSNSKNPFFETTKYMESENKG